MIHNNVKRFGDLFVYNVEFRYRDQFTDYKRYFKVIDKEIDEKGEIISVTVEYVLQLHQYFLKQDYYKEIETIQRNDIISEIWAAIQYPNQ